MCLPKACVSRIVVDIEHTGRRIDNFLSSVLKGVPKDRIYRMLRSGEVRVNGGRVRQGHRLTSGEILRIPPVYSSASPAPAAPAASLQAMLRARVVFEDDALLVLDKPAGIAVHAGAGVRHGVIEGLRALRPEAPYLELVHRLDRSTSGCLMIAKRPRVLRTLHAGLRAGAIEKEYLALVRGDWRGGRRVVAVPLRKSLMRSGERIVGVDQGGKPSETRMWPIEVFDGASLIGVELGSGRTHQIRVHAAHIGYPVAGDCKYGDPSFNRRMRSRGLGVLFLHAGRLKFRHPECDHEVTVTANLPQPLASVLETLRGEGISSSRPRQVV